MRSLFEQAPFYFLLASSSTVLFLLKLGLLSLGLGKDVDATLAEVDGADQLGGKDSVSAFSFLSSQSILAFLMGFGWLALAAKVEWNLTIVWVLPVAGIFGFLMMLMTALIGWWITKLEQVGRSNRWSLVGSQAKVYLTVPARGQGEGQIELVLDGARRIVRAINADAEPIPSFSEVVVVSVEGKRLVIKRKD